MNWIDVASQLFGSAHDIRADGNFLSGSASFDGQVIAVVGSTDMNAAQVRALRQEAGT